MIRAYGGLQFNPDAYNLIYATGQDEYWGAVFRLLCDGGIGNNFSFNANLLETAGSVSVAQQQNTPKIGTERSGMLLRNQHDTTNSRAYIALDTFQGQWTTDLVDFTFGRQPVNLATTFYFTPNDLFAPFNAQDFYRVYKPGVDGGRTDIRLGDFSLLSLIAVLGYSPDASTDNGWSKDPEWDRTSLIGRLSVSAHDFEWALLGGTAHDIDIIGASLQGEIFDWLGIRAEGHYGHPEDSILGDYSELVIGFEHHFENSLDLRLEYFYHGLGYPSIDAANTALLTGTAFTPYLGRNYTAIGAGYEFNPLLIGQMLLLTNWTDDSLLLSGTIVYSLSDESELVATASFPFGDEPAGTLLQSEYGSLPQTISVEYRLYF